MEPVMFELSNREENVPVLARAIVKEVKDPENRGRIKLEYPTFGEKSKKYASKWARVCSPYASSESGAWFLPEKGDEVMVHFEDGNLQAPIVMGSLYSGKHKPPTSGRNGDKNSDGKNNLKFIKTRSGHTLCFDDSPDKRAIVLKDSDGRQLEINSKEGELQLTDEQNNKLSISKKEISLKNSGGDHVTLKKGKVVIQGAASIELGENAMSKLIKGDLFQSFFNSHTHMTAWGPSSPPLIPMNPGLLTTKTKAT